MRPPFHFLSFVAVACLLAGSTGDVQAQQTGTKDDPDGILVPEGLKRQLETPPQQGQAADQAEEEAPVTPRTLLSEGARESIVGKLISFRGQVLTLEVNDGEVRKFQVAQSATVRRDGQLTTVTELQPMDVVRLLTSGDPEQATVIIAASPPPATDREPDMALRQRQQERQLNHQNRRRTDVAQADGTRVWVLMVGNGDALAQQGIRAGDLIIVADRQMVTSDNVLSGIKLNSGLFPLRTTRSGQAALGAVSTTTGRVGVVVPLTGEANVPATGTPGATTNQTTSGAREPSSEDQNFGPPIGQRSGGGDRNFGPPIGTGDNPNSTNQQRQPPPAPTNPDGGSAQTPSTGGSTPSSATAGEGAAGGGTSASSGSGNPGN